MIGIEARKALALIAATTMLLVLGGCWPCSDCQPEKDIVYAWDIPESQDNCAAGTIFTDNSGGEGGDLDGTGIVDRDGTGIVDRDSNLVLKYCKRPCGGGEVPGPTIFMVWNNPNDFVEAGPDCEAP
jgi:hypothetical protein